MTSGNQPGMRTPPKPAQRGGDREHNNKEIVPMDIVFENPPASAAGRPSDSSLVAESLKARPGEWAMIGRRPTSSASNIKNGLVRAYRPAGSFEAVTRNGDTKTADIYARYVGENREHS